MMTPIYATLIGYLFGNFLTAMIVGEIFLKINPTQYGSHNPGTANMGAVFGKKWGILTCLGDLLKSLIALFTLKKTAMYSTKQKMPAISLKRQGL